ncbi:MAG: cache domain-containing protein, partial [Methanocorpusculum sp.]|nr:cache domain-containing protein [Methanocorpusculum sp.]
LNQPKLVYDNVYKLTTEQTLKDVEDLFKFSVLNALSDTFERVNSGYYNSYIYILDMDGKIVSSSENNTIGVNYLNSRGAYGYSYISSMIYSAQQGGGYVYYMYPVDGSFRAEASQYSLGYIMPINNDYFIFGRFSGDEDAQPIDYSIRSDSSSVAREIINQVSLKGIDSIIYEINSDPENAQEKFVPNLTTNVEDIAVIDMHGNLYASVYNPTLVGESLTSHTDVYGTSIIRKLIMHAKNGGGFMSDLTQSKDRGGYVDLWLICVEPVDNNYFITTAAIIGTYEDVLTPYLKK